MARRTGLISEAGIIRKSIISDYVRLSLKEGVTPGEAFRELKRKLNTLKKLQDKTAG